jgi:hypothetical protein
MVTFEIALLILQVKPIRIVYFSILLAFIAIGCVENTPFQKNISEGIIEYDVTYPELDSNNLMLEMLPDKMIMKFKKDRYKSELKTAAGIIEMSVLANATEQKMYNLVKIFSDRYVLEMNRAQALAMTSVSPPFQTEFKDEWKKIADAQCQKVLLDFGTSKKESYIFYFTNEIDIVDPNWWTPYGEIKGVLLDYRFENYNMVMRLTATKIISQPIEDSEFLVGSEFKPLTPEEFDQLVVKNMEIFME